MPLSFLQYITVRLQLQPFQRFLSENIELDLIQLPWINDEQIRAFGNSKGNLIFHDSTSSLRTSIMEKNIPSCLPMIEFYSPQ